MPCIYIHFGSPSRTSLELSPSQGLLRAVIQWQFIDTALLYQESSKDGGQTCRGLRHLQGPSTSSASWSPHSILTGCGPRKSVQMRLIHPTNQDTFSSAMYPTKSGQSWLFWKVCFQLSSSQRTMYNYSLILIPQNLVCINRVSRVKTRTKRKFQFLHSFYRACSHHQHRYGNE